MDSNPKSPVREKRPKTTSPHFKKKNFEALSLGQKLIPLKNPDQDFKMAYFHSKNPNLGLLWRALEWKILVYFRTIWNILLPFGIFYGILVYFVVIWYFSILVCLDQEKSGNLCLIYDLLYMDYQ
jgi:hypothetical protein